MRMHASIVPAACRSMWPPPLGMRLARSIPPASVSMPHALAPRARFFKHREFDATRLPAILPTNANGDFFAMTGRGQAAIGVERYIRMIVPKLVHSPCALLRAVSP